MDKGRKDEALEVISSTRQGPLARMIALFGETREIIRRSNSEIAVVVERDGVSVALTVDAVDSVETLARDSVEPIPAGQGGQFDNLISYLGKRQESEEMVLLLDIGRLLDQTRGIAPNTN